MEQPRVKSRVLDEMCCRKPIVPIAWELLAKMLMNRPSANILPSFAVQGARAPSSADGKKQNVLKTGDRPTPGHPGFIPNGCIASPAQRSPSHKLFDRRVRGQTRNMSSPSPMRAHRQDSEFSPAEGFLKLVDFDMKSVVEVPITFIVMFRAAKGLLEEFKLEGLEFLLHTRTTLPAHSAVEDSTKNGLPNFGPSKFEWNCVVAWNALARMPVHPSLPDTGCRRRLRPPQRRAE